MSKTSNQKPLVFGVDLPFPGAHYWEHPGMQAWLLRHNEKLARNRRRALALVLCWMAARRLLGITPGRIWLYGVKGKTTGRENQLCTYSDGSLPPPLVKNNTYFCKLTITTGRKEQRQEVCIARNIEASTRAEAIQRLDDWAGSLGLNVFMTGPDARLSYSVSLGPATMPSVSG